MGEGLPNIPYRPKPGYVVVVFQEMEKVSAGGIVIPDTSIGLETRGVVVSVGAAAPPKRVTRSRYDPAGLLLWREVEEETREEISLKPGNVVWARPSNGEPFDYLDEEGNRQKAYVYRPSQFFLEDPDGDR